MEAFVIKNDITKISSINRTIRVKTEIYDEIMELCEIYQLSFNRIVNQCLEYALKNLECGGK